MSFRFAFPPLAFAPACLVVFGSALCSNATNVTLTWGVREANLPEQRANMTFLREADGTAFTVDGFNARYEMSLFDVGDGTFDEEAGFATMRLIETTNAVFKTKWSNPFAVEGRTYLPVTYVGDWGDHGDIDAYVDDYLDALEEGLDRELTDLEVENETKRIYALANAYYTPLWRALHFVTVVRDKDSGAMYRVSETPGGTAFLALEAPTNMTVKVEGVGTGTGTPPNVWHMTVHCDSKSAYLGAPLPARCVWMTDLGLTTNDLAGVSERRIALATALGKTPAEVADVTLEIDGIDLANGSVSYAFDVVAPNGTTNAVTALKYGAELRLLGGTELGRWTTTNVVDVAGRTVAAPTGGEARFYRLELAVP